MWSVVHRLAICVLEESERFNIEFTYLAELVNQLLNANLSYIIKYVPYGAALGNAFNYS